MKKLYTVILFITLLVVSTRVSFAEDGSSSPKPLFGRLQGVRQQIKQKIATNEGQRKTNIAALRKDIVTNFFNMMFTRFQAAEDRLTKITGRIDSRVSKIKASNPTLDLTAIDSEVASVKTALSNNQIAINTLKTDFDTTIASDTPKERFKTVLTDISTVKKNLENIRKSLSKIIGDIKGLKQP